MLQQLHLRQICRTLAVITFFLTFSASSVSNSAELLLFEDEYCSWCQLWDKEIGGIYNLTPESCQAELRRIDINESVPDNIHLSESIIYTPTFVLVHEKIERGRIVGYPGEDFFWGMLNELIAAEIPDETRKLNSSNCKIS